MEKQEAQGWDNLAGTEILPDDILPFIESCEDKTCVLIRTRKDGHPIGAVVGYGVQDGEIYLVTDLYRAAHSALRRDPRCSAVFDDPQRGSVTVIARAELIDDLDFIRQFFWDRSALSAQLRTGGQMTAEEFFNMSFTPNRRLIHIIPEKYITIDLTKLPTGRPH